ncbi:MAG: glycerol-3-phosphate dehydrogenase/oxidase, partial [Acidimicrobiales bacterium]
MGAGGAERGPDRPLGQPGGATAGGRLDPAQRRAAVEALAGRTFDVVVVGGGVTGAGCALDAATRGLSVALVEARDWAAGTSSRSSKLIHGGLRYLEMLDVGLVREALRERGLLLDVVAPHLVHPVLFMYPLHGFAWERAYVGAGLALYDAMGGSRSLPRHRHLGRRRTLALAPGLRREGLRGAVMYYDAQVDDARYVTTLVRTAAHHGAVVARSVAVTGWIGDGGRVVGVRAVDDETGLELSIRASHVVNATGVWTEETTWGGTYRDGGAGRPGPASRVGAGSAARTAKAPGQGADQPRVRSSKGVHLVVPRDRIELETAVISRAARSVLLILPWKDHWIIGTTDTDWQLGKDDPPASRADLSYLLDHANAVLQDRLTPADVEGVYAGLRPLVAAKGASTARLSRSHRVWSPAPGVTSVVGGKYTTYRVMAKDTIDAVAVSLGRAVPESCTDRIPLLGAAGWSGDA